MHVVLATNNAAKVRELQALMGSLRIHLVTQGSMGIAEAQEPHRSFVENALAKARHAAQGSGHAALADDSGLCVDALGGLPGVDSAHIAGHVSHTDSDDAKPGLGCPTGDAKPVRERRRAVQDRANNAWLLDRLQGQPDRRAHYVCVLVGVRRADDPAPLIAVARWQGLVLQVPQGEGGFGYDPLMMMEGQTLSVASLAAETKNALSHRALAAADIRVQLREIWRVEPSS